MSNDDPSEQLPAMGVLRAEVARQSAAFVHERELREAAQAEAAAAQVRYTAA